jgi:hypothetical protein
VSFHWKDYRIDGLARWKTMTLTTFAFIRRFLIHVLPRGFHRIRHYGLFANGNRAANVARARELLGRASPELAEEDASVEPDTAHAAVAACWSSRSSRAVAGRARGQHRSSSGPTPHEVLHAAMADHCPSMLVRGRR